MAVKASVNTQNQTTVRVGQQNAIRVTSTAAGINAADTATTAVNVVGGRADVTQLAVSGLSTFTGIVTTASDLYVGGDLYLTNDLVLDNIAGSSLIISGISSVGFITATDVWVSGAVTATNFYGDGSNLTGIVVTGGDSTFSNIDISGITTTSVLKIGTGITASAGIITANSIDAAISEWVLGADGISHYTFTGPGLIGAENDPTIYLKRGQKYRFKNASGGHPFRIQTTFQDTEGTAYDDGITNNPANNGTTLIWDVQFDTPDVLYYQCTAHTNMSGKIYIGNSGESSTIGNLSISGLSTYIGIATYKDDVFIDGTLTAGVIDGGTY